MLTSDFPKYFEVPTQVAFVDDFAMDEAIDNNEKPKVLGGIAFKSYIIRGECGSMINLDDVAYLDVLSWVDISDEIIGDIDCWEEE